MPFLESVLVVIEMTCTAKQQTISQVETLELIECEETVISEQIDREDEKIRKLRKHLAQKEALKQLEQRKAHALAVAHRMSFIR
ncbi:MAG: hypothetical protein ACW975_04710 [Candidatus Thorarchaeota archaeon]|jgi:5-bromo-4-chloroindolyl phosphate hydrolysis protein